MLFISRLRMGWFDQNQFTYFLKNFIFFIVLITIVLYSNFYINQKSINRSADVVFYNRILLYCFLSYFVVFIFNIYSTEQKLLSKLMTILFFSVLFIFISNYLIVSYFSLNFWKGLLISTGSSIGIYLLFAFSSWYTIYNQGLQLSEPVFLQFNYAVSANFNFLIISLVFFPLFLLLFYLLNYNNSFGQYMTQNVTKFMVPIYLWIIGFIYAIKARIINPKQILSTYIVVQCLFYVTFILGFYILLTNLTNMCAGVLPYPKNISRSNQIQFLTILLIGSILYILVLDDKRQWKFYDYAAYIAISVFIFLCLFQYSTTFPQLSVLSFWGFIEWCILSIYNKEDAFNSFSYMMMDNKYNLV